MDDQLQVAVGFPIEFQSIEIPESVKELIICQGLDYSQDECDQHRRRVQLREIDYGAMKGTPVFFFDHETEGMDSSVENEYVDLLIEYLGTLGFSNWFRGEHNKHFEGRRIWLGTNAGR